MTVIDNDCILWAVLDAADQVVVMCSGGDAQEFIDEWVERGYRAVAVTADGRRAA